MNEGTWADWFAGTMSGLAVIAALAGYFIADWYRRRDRREIDVATAQLVGLKLFKVTNSSHDLYRHLWAPYDGPALGGVADGVELWRTISPLVGLQIDESMRLDASEMGLLVRMEKVTFLTELMLATSRYDSMVLSMREYQTRHEVIHQMTPPPVEMEGRVGKHQLTREEYMRIQPYAVAQEHLVRFIRDMARENVEKCGDLAEQFHPMMKAYFKGEKFIALGRPPLEPASPGSL